MMNNFNLKKNLYVCSALIITTIALAVSGETEVKHRNVFTIENFSDANDVKILPPGWHASRKDCSMFTIISESDDNFVRLNVQNKCTSFGKPVTFSTDSMPFLKWKWRVITLPEGGCENKKSKNDSGAGVYVVFKGAFKLNKIIKYVWSSTLPVGTTVASPYNSSTKIIVLQSGNENLGEWINEIVNIRTDFIRLFKSEPPVVVGIAILTDSDNTSSSAIADYDDFQALMQIPSVM
jgi:hypothetical protein